MTTAVSARVEPRYQYMPEMGGWDYEQLRDSIAKNGMFIEHAVVVDEDGRILDGHHRAKACAELGIECPTREKSGLSEEQKDEYIWAVNVPRRHLSPEQKRALMTHRLVAKPEESDRRIGADLGVDGKTVAKQRAALEASAEIPQTTRPHQRTDQLPHHVVGTDVAKHLDVPVIELTVRHMGPSSKPERTRAGEPYDQAQEIIPWYSGELPVPHPIPSSLAEVDPFLLAVAAELRRQIVGPHPFKTMLASVYR